MYLKSLEINGFKSFAKKGVLDFGSTIVGIVGPNGSGKSNVAEAFRFVLGEQSMKSMRGKRGEDLIFNGGKNMPKMNRASVKLVFDNTRRIFNIDFDEVSLERAVHRDGVNDYFINGSSVRLKDVMELLASANIGASGHHIISQGEADRILNASIKERRAMIEDALGLKVYQFKRTESERKLEKTAENIRQVESLRKEIAPHIKFLEKQMEKVRKAEELRNELTHFYQEYLSHEEAYLASEKREIEEARALPVKEFHDIERKISEARRLIEESEKGDSAASELLEIEKALQDADQIESGIKNALSRLEGEIAAQQRALMRAESEVHTAISNSVSLVELEELHRDMAVLANQHHDYSDSITLKNIIEKLLAALSTFIHLRKNAPVENKLAREIEAEINKLTEDVAMQQEALVQANSDAVAIRQHYELFRKKREDETSRGRSAERELFALMNRRTELNAVLFALQSREEKRRQAQTAFEEELKEASVLVGRDALHYNVANVTEETRSTQEERRKKLERMKIRLEESGGAGGEEMRKEYEDITERDRYLSREIEDLVKSAETLKNLIVELQEKLETEFKAGIEKINKEFGAFFTLMFGGGSASLSVSRDMVRKKKSDYSLDDENAEEDEVEGDEGIDISVSLPNKRVKGLSMLSGGERALTSIALLFAISQVNPPPFVILDETDAALDEANSRKYGDMIENLAKYSQLIVITHNRETMSRAGILYGVTMGAEGYSKLLSVKFDEAVAVAK